MSISKQQVKINNLLDNSYHTDTLHLKTFSNISCNSKRCMGSLMQVDADHLSDTPRTKEELLSHATDFINQYYDDIKRQNTPAHHKRLKEVQHCIERNETYELTFAELSFGAKTAWRNAPRCIGRIQWSKLQVFDARHINTPLEMYLALCNHIKYATNGGNLRSSITVFPQRMKGRQDFRVWNGQFIRYAGYKMDDDTIVGDPASLEFTEQCIKLGWKPKYGRFDVLPLVVSAPGSEPHCFDIPEDIVLEVKIKHPKYPWFADLRLQWFALPGVSKMLFDCGGLEFTACPFNGWYMGTEIGARDFCDANRYNLLEPIADKLELDTTTTASLWKDRVLVEVNIAVLYSYQCAGVTISDHHEASESFIRHIKNEQKLRGGCPGDWVWVVPPMSGCALEVFHQEMLLYKLKPSFEYQDDPWHSLEVSTILPRESKRRSSFKTIARVVMEFSKLLNRAMVKRTRCLILYATETGKSENFARSLAEIFSHAFLVKVVCMEDYDIIELEHESLVLVVASTFGNGEAPENGKEFVKNLQMYRSTASNESKLEDFKSIQKFNYRKSHGTLTFPKPSKRQRPSLFDEPARFSNFRFSVFGLGSKAYPQFAAFGYYVDNLFEALGAERLLPIATGDALCKQEYSFRKWSERIYKSSCKAFCLDLNLSTDARNIGNSFWAPDKFKVTISSNTSKQDLCEILSKFHGKKIVPCTTLDRIQLQSPDSPRQTFLMKLDTHGAMELMYSPGDHIGIFPANSSESVDAILERVAACPNPDKNIELHVMNETVDLKGLSKTWKLYEKMPLCSLRTALTYLLDITTMPSQDFLLAMSFMASNEQDKDRLNQLCTNQKAYEQFKFHQNPTLLDVLNHFPKVKVLPALLLTMLPALQQRYYSISSSPQMFPGQIHVTVAVVAYSLQDGSGSVREGVCSNWLNRCPPKTVVPSFVRSI
ncbi:nitric oxide synthase-like isoform X2 [Biomphalaria glabrata]|uniref:nitric-oxide synthase (NADPH) n=1 Tax=Biomphalaria glabrata TaxID=6526 RepID=A0A9W2YFR5_BIOGL|nr:nitric oxide synthase-like isoform X2 [Biomphalaria glabrata]